MRKRVISFLVALILTVSCLYLDGQAARAADARVAGNGCPYYIMVNRTANTVTVYGLDEQGYYTKPVKAMICSVGRQGSETPTGNYSVTGYKYPWLRMVDGSYGQYATQFYGNYLFHSLCYSKADPSALLTYEYNALGGPASLGCVRLQAADAKWIYDNCAARTMVTIYDDEDPGPLGKPERQVSEITPELDNGWDPTDPRENNPWRELLAAELTLDRDRLTLAKGETAVLTAARTPESAQALPITWASSDPSIVTVDGNGGLTAVGEGTAVVTASCGIVSVSCTVTVSGVLVTGVTLDETELFLVAGEAVKLTVSVSPAGATVPARATWASSDPSTATVDSAGNVTTMGAGTAVITAAYGSVSASCTVTVSGQLLPFTDVIPGAWYYGDVRYAYENGILGGTGATTFSPNSYVTYAMVMQTLYRMSGTEQKEQADADGDASQDVWYSAAFRWAAASGLMDGATDSAESAESACDPNEAISRQELAALLYRYETALCGRRVEGFASLSQFSDGRDVYLLARDAMSWAVGNGLIQGTADGKLQPNGRASRAQMAAILRRYDSLGIK